ncbi:DUF3572 domain-containing protein [Terrihabitans rhizophilus]|jgi:hypothetical protein|uniref:DUF3572 domain-containing protein n=1 Tax=Terrihabitans rhizophilus TaxID=3092662 RepID=A0ABU4RJZ8_9HYPH|nr:DUF3572 domain-containing protein [Terrihabitans sp. PJ23]MDX6805169.1 DUF3572 domain-containing protein [Terrihabitans sp. PJ23]
MKVRGIQPDPADLAGQALLFLAGDAEQLGAFLAVTGLDPRRIREAAKEHGFLAGVLDHILGDEKLLLRFSSESGVAPERVAEARRALGGANLH